MGYSHGSMAIEDAIRGEGVTLGRSVLVGDDIAAGRLVAPFPAIVLPVERGYDLLCSTASREKPQLQALRSWLLDEVRFHGGRHADLSFFALSLSQREEVSINCGSSTYASDREKCKRLF